MYVYIRIIHSTITSLQIHSLNFTSFGISNLILHKSNMDSEESQQPPFQSPFATISLNPDGTVNRPPLPRIPANADPNRSSGVLSKDVVLDSKKNTWIRIYIPKLDAPPEQKLPLIVYYHGGGFVFCHADTFVFDVFCQGLVNNINAVVISLEYRLTPEHRLPAAYEDSMDAFYWIQNTKDEWVEDYADLNNIFVLGSSAGGNIVYHAGLGFCSKADDLNKLRIRGLMFHQPFISAKKRTGSEERLADNWLIPLHALDKMLDLSLPKGTDRDHEYCNLLGSKMIILDEMKTFGWRALVTGCFGDPLVDAGMEFAKMLESQGVKTFKFFGEGYHGMEIFEPIKSGPLFDVIKSFIYK